MTTIAEWPLIVEEDDGLYCGKCYESFLVKYLQSPETFSVDAFLDALQEHINRHSED